MKTDLHLRSRMLIMGIRIPGSRLLPAAASKFAEDDCVTLALSISFVFLLSIIPLTTLSILLFDFIRHTFFVRTAWSGNIAEMLADEIVQIIPFVSKQWIKSHVVNPDAYRSFKAINILMLPIISGLIFKTLETSFRKIFQLPSRHLLLGQAVYIIMSIFTVLLFFMANFAWIILSTTGSHLLSTVNAGHYLDAFYHFTRTVIGAWSSSLVSVLVLMTFYLISVKLFLNVKIKLWHRLVSGIIFCLLWLLARKIFSLYIQHISGVNVLYGSLSSVILTLMWIFYSSLALLFSVEMMQVLHAGPYRRQRKY